TGRTEHDPWNPSASGWATGPDGPDLNFSGLIGLGDIFGANETYRIKLIPRLPRRKSYLLNVFTKSRKFRYIDPKWGH
ncbi:MAG: hypothetical protein KAW46_04285, partial [candidate division Zixibacteria bacterium]|nr:hypothetical protein [candidate division Zixibacteria bacterium]